MIFKIIDGKKVLMADVTPMSIISGDIENGVQRAYEYTDVISGIADNNYKKISGHIANNTIHITQEERNIWNDRYIHPSVLITERPEVARTLDYGSTITVPVNQYDSSGHIEEIRDEIYTLPNAFDPSALETAISGKIGIPIWNPDNQTITFKADNGEEKIINIPFEALIEDFNYDPETNEIVLTTKSGDDLRIDVSHLINIYTGSTGTHIDIGISNNNSISGILKNDSIENIKLNSALRTEISGKLNSNDPSVTNSRTPTGVAGGDLTGSYPNPTLRTDKFRRFVSGNISIPNNSTGISISLTGFADANYSVNTYQGNNEVFFSIPTKTASNLTLSANTPGSVISGITLVIAGTST